MPSSRCASASARASRRLLSGCSSPRLARLRGAGLRPVGLGRWPFSRPPAPRGGCGGGLIVGGQLFDDLALVADVLLGQLFDADQRVARLGGHPDELVELEVERLGVAALRVLN